MANTPAVIEHIPAHLVKYRQEGFNERFKTPAGEPIGRVSIEGKVFTFIFQEDRELVQTPEGHPMPFLDVCIIDANEATSKTFYLKGFEKGSSDAPDCSSISGDRPEPGSPHPQSKTCAACEWNKFQTATRPDGSVGKGKRCQDAKRIAILPAWDFDNKDWGGPMLLRVPPTSFKDFNKYWKEQDGLGRDLNLIVTRLRFDPQAPHPKVFFNFQRWITEEEASLMHEWATSEHIKRVLMVTQADLDGVDDAELDPEPEALAPPQRTQAEGAAAAKIAQRRAATQQPAPTPPQRRPATATEASAPRPNGPVRRSPVQQAAEETAAPPRRTSATATPVQQPAKGSATPVETPEQMRARKKAELAELLARATALDEDLNTPAGDEEQTVNGVVVDPEYQGEDDTGEVSTTDLLAAIDADELSGIPD